MADAPDNRNLDRMGDALREMLHAEPFAQFDIKMADGDTIRVIHQDYAILSPNKRQALAYDKDGHFRIVNMQLVTTIEPVRPAKKRTGKR